jgi:hypothetical protein
MASLSELANVMQTGPAEAFRSADIGYQQYGLQQQALQQAKQDMAPQQPLAGMAGGMGAGGKPQGLGAMAGNLLGPQYKLITADGELTSSGLVNQTLVTAQTEAQQAAQAKKQANFYNAMGKPEIASQYDQESRRLQTRAQQTLQDAQKQKAEAKDDFSSALYGAKSQEDYDRRLKDALERTGIEPPKDFPTTWSPDMKEKLLSKMSPTMRAKVEKQDRDEAAALRAERALADRERRQSARDQNGLAGPSKTYETLEEKVNDPSYGVAKGKTPAREQTVARRITLDSREVTQGINQVMSLTEGGMKDTTGTTFANVKDNGLLTAPVKFFTNKISDKDSAMYDAMMYPLVKGVALFQNPDYRPTDNDVKIAMNAYKAQAGQPQAIQLEKLAELKKNYLVASESFLDSAILNPQQANSLKQQIKYVEKAIPWDVNDVVNFTRQKDTKDFKTYLGSKGKQVETTKPEQPKPSQAKPTPTADDIALAKSSPGLAAKFEAHFGVKP